MRKTILAFISILLCGSYLFAQSGETSPCPTITVTGPAALVTPGDNVIFTADVDSSQKLEYKWTVSNGEISSGQNSFSIMVSTTEKMAGSSVTAIVEIKGLPENCLNKNSETAFIKQPGGYPITIEDYKKLSFENEKAKLAGVVSLLKKNSDFIALFLIYYSPNSNLQLFKKRILDIENFLTEDQKMPSNRFSFVFVKRESEQTRIFLIPTNSDLEKLNWKEALEKLSNN